MHCEKNNAMGHISGKHSVVKGDCRVTVKQLLEKRPNLIISLAFFDLNSFEPTKDVLELMIVKRNLVLRLTPRCHWLIPCEKD